VQRSSAYNLGTELILLSIRALDEFLDAVCTCPVQKMTRRGGAGKGSGSQGYRSVEYGQTCTEDGTGAVALRAALESAVQLRRGEVNRQAEMANPNATGVLQKRSALRTFASAAVLYMQGAAKYMHEFHADRDHALCNIQNSSIPVVQLTQL
jgi:hypothetical protein